MKDTFRMIYIYKYFFPRHTFNYSLLCITLKWDIFYNQTISWSTAFKFHRKNGVKWLNYYSLFFLSNKLWKLGQFLLWDLKRIGQRINRIHKRNLCIKQHGNVFKRRASFLDLFFKIEWYMVTNSKILEQTPSFNSEMYITISNSNIYSCWELKNGYFLIVLSDTLMYHGLWCNALVYSVFPIFLIFLLKSWGAESCFLWWQRFEFSHVSIKSFYPY